MCFSASITFKSSKMNRIIMYTSGDITKGKVTGGVKRFVELTRYICNHFNNAILCSMSNDVEVKKYGVQNHIALSPVKKNRFFSFLFPELAIVLSNKNVLSSLKNKKYDKIVVFDVPPAIGLVLWGFKHIVLMIRKDMIGYECVATKHRSLKFYLKILFQWMCEAICLSRSELIITQCLYDRDILIKRHPFLKKSLLQKTKIQINNVNPSWIQQTISESSVPHNPFKICFIGDFDNDRKGHDLLLDVAIKIQELNVCFIMIGGGEKLEIYKSKFQSDRVIFKGRHNNPSEQLVNCDLLVVPSLADSCPNTVLEAMNCGVPVIGSRAGGIPEILPIEEALFDLTSESLGQLIERIINDEDYRQELLHKEQIRKRELQFNWEEKITNLILSNP